MKTKMFNVSFYIEGNDELGYFAYQSQSSPNDTFGWGKTVNEAVSNLCRLLSGEFNEPVEPKKNRVTDFVAGPLRWPTEAGE